MRCTTPLRPLLLSLSMVAAAAACLPATNDFDPANPNPADATITGQVSVWLTRDEPLEVVGGRNVEVIIGGQVVVPDDDGAFALAVPQGVYSVFARGDNLATTATVGPFELAPGQDWKVNETGALRLVDIVPPSPPFLAPAPEVTILDTVELTVLNAGEDDGLLDSIQVQVNGVLAGAWTAHSVDSNTLLVELEPDRLNTIAYHVKDGRKNASENQFAFVRQDSTPPAPPEVQVVAANDRLDVTWLPGDRILDGDLVARDVAFYRVFYGLDDSAIGGTTANEGVSPIIVTNEEKLRLTGLNDGQTLFVAVEAVDAAGLSARSDTVVSGTPNIVTPEVRASTPLASAAQVVRNDAQRIYILREGGQIDVRGRHTHALLTTIDGPASALDIAVWGERLFVAAGSEGVFSYRISNLDNIPPAVSTPLPVGFDGPGQAAIAFNVQRTQGFATVRGPQGGLWRLSLATGDNPPTTIAYNAIDALSGVDPTTLTGASAINGRFLATQYYASDDNPGAEGNLNSADHLAIFDLDNLPDAAAPRLCATLSPTAGVGEAFQEAFVDVGDGTVQNPTTPAGSARKQFHFVGDVLAMPYDGAVVLYRPNLNPNACQSTGNGAFITTNDNAIGVVSLGFRTAYAVQMAGASMYVASRGRILSIAGTAPLLPPRLDVVDLSTRQDTAGASGSVVAPLLIRGGIDIDATAGVVAHGPNIDAARDELHRIEAFSPLALSPVSASGDNPTGRVVGMGPYVIHQRALSGIAAWNIMRPAAPVQENGGTCVPGCFQVQDLAGTPQIESGVLIGALTAPDANNTTSVVVVSVGSDVGNLAAWAQAPNPCSTGPVQGFAVHGRYALVGCADVGEVWAADLVNEGTSFATGGVLPMKAVTTQLSAPVADLSVQHRPEGDGTFLIVLDRDGALATIALPAILGDAADLPPLTDQLPSTGLEGGRRLLLDGDALYVLGRKPCASDASDCQSFSNHIAKLNLGSGAFTEINGKDSTAYAHDEQTAHLAAYGDITLLGRADADNRYEARTAFFEDPVAVASPNPLPLHATFWGGHMISASMTMYALE